MRGIVRRFVAAGAIVESEDRLIGAAVGEAEAVGLAEVTAAMFVSTLAFALPVEALAEAEVVGIGRLICV